MTFTPTPCGMSFAITTATKFKVDQNRSGSKGRRRRDEKTGCEGANDVGDNARVGSGVGGCGERPVEAALDCASAVRFRGRGKNASRRPISCRGCQPSR